MSTVNERFWAKVDKTPGQGPQGTCWEWRAATAGKGYGVLRVAGKQTYAHRLSYELCYGPLGNLFALHKCDNPKCVNPSHLFAGTRWDNAQDMTRKGRNVMQTRPELAVKGELVNTAKLTQAQVRAIRGKYATKPGRGTLSTLGREYNVSPQSIWAIVRRLTWKHVA